MGEGPIELRMTSLVGRQFGKKGDGEGQRANTQKRNSQRPRAKKVPVCRD